MSALLEFHDSDGDPIYVRNDILAIFTQVDKTTLSSFYGEPVATSESDPLRVIISKSTGKWEVTESYEEILALIDSIPCES